MQIVLAWLDSRRNQFNNTSIRKLNLQAQLIQWPKWDDEREFSLVCN